MLYPDPKRNSRSGEGSGVVETKTMTEAISREQAMIYAMVTMAAVDREIVDSELRRIGTMVRELPPFRAFDDAKLVEESQVCGQIMSGPGGLNKILEIVATTLPKHLRETCYVLAAEVAVSDHEIRPEERRFLQLLANNLGIDPLIASALERGARARHQRARPEDA
ncbi:MAG: tellurite resistance TerB family protein [Pseudomonadota bacterium]